MNPDLEFRQTIDGASTGKWTPLAWNGNGGESILLHTDSEVSAAPHQIEIRVRVPFVAGLYRLRADESEESNHNPIQYWESPPWLGTDVVDDAEWERVEVNPA